MKAISIILIMVAVGMLAVSYQATFRLSSYNYADITLISPEDGVTINAVDGKVTIKTYVKTNVLFPLIDIVVEKNGLVWDEEHYFTDISQNGAYVNDTFTLPNGTYTWHVEVWYKVSSTYTTWTLLKKSEERTFTITGYMPPEPKKKPPVIKSFYVPSTAKTGQDVTVTVNAHDPDGYIKSYIFNFGDGYRVATRRSAYTHSYFNPGIYNVSVKVIDSDGLTAKKTKQITITGEPVKEGPIIAKLKITPENAQVGQQIEADASGSYDNDSKIVSYVFSWEDGPVFKLNTPKSYHIYTKPGTYTVTVTVTNSKGETATDSKQVNVDGNIPAGMYILNTEVIPQYAGRIILEPPGGVYEPNTKVDVYALAYTGYIFNHWEGDLTGSAYITNITMNSNKSITAVFRSLNPEYCQININVNPKDGGTVEITPDGGEYKPGTVVTITAHANNGYKFSHWEGDLTGDNPSITLDINKDISAVAIFYKEDNGGLWQSVFTTILGFALMGISLRRK